MTDMEINKFFTEIYEQTYRSVFKYVLAKCNNTSSVQDIIQNAYISFYNRLNKSGNELREPKKYLMKIVKNEVYKHYGVLERLKKHIPVFSKLDEEDFSNIEFEFLSEEICYDKVLCDDLWNYIKNEDMLTFKIFNLYFVYDLKITEIAEELNINQSTVKNRLYRSLKQMRQQFNL